MDFQKILKKAISDLMKLETEGITKEDLVLPSQLMYKNIFFKGTVSVLIAANRAVYEIGGLVENFNSLGTCRFCMVTKHQMINTFSAKELVLRSHETYNSHLNVINQDPTANMTRGIKKKSALNDLHHYHNCWGSPSDIVHDIFEGFGNDLIKHTVEYVRV